MQVEVEVGSRQVLQVVSIYQRLNQHRHPNLGWNQKNPRKYVSFLYELHINYSFYFCTAKQHFLAVTDEQGTLRVLEIPKNLRVASRGEVSLVKFSVVQHCLKQDRSPCCLSESLVMACMYSKRQTCRLPFFCACRAFTWKDTLGWRKMCWKISSWSKNCGKKRRSRKLRPQRQRWDASEISN